jgi:hypothetical protein
MLLALRSHGDWQGIIELLERVARAPTRVHRLEVCQIEGMALNRAGFSQRAEQVLLRAIACYGPDSETLGILGRVYKDRFVRATEIPETEYWLDQAIAAYLTGALCNPGEVYPLINILTLNVCRGKPCPLYLTLYLIRLLNERFKSGKGDYFDLATGIEVAVIFRWWDIAELFVDLLPCISAEAWEFETTSNNLALLTSPVLDVCPKITIDLIERLRAQAPKLDVRHPLSNEQALTLVMRTLVEMSRRLSFACNPALNKYLAHHYAYYRRDTSEQPERRLFLPHPAISSSLRKTSRSRPFRPRVF